jgi:hypothetical protein
MYSAGTDARNVLPGQASRLVNVISGAAMLRSGTVAVATARHIPASRTSSDTSTGPVP